jgi:hypothetical protein
MTGFETEETVYRALYSRDVNNYVAVKPDGKTKTKGAYANDPDEVLKKNPTNIICIEALTSFLSKGTPIEDTVTGCRDIRKFVTVRKVAGGAQWRGNYLGKTVRWYRSTQSQWDIGYWAAMKKDGEPKKVGGSDNAMPLMELPAEFPADVDLSWYVREVYEMLMDIGHTVRPPKERKSRKAKLAEIEAGAGTAQEEAE